MSEQVKTAGESLGQDIVSEAAESAVGEVSADQDVAAAGNAETAAAGVDEAPEGEAADEPTEEELAAARELAEELGVSGVSLTAHERFYFDCPDNHLWCAVFSAVWDGPLHVQPEEVQQACFMPVAQALRLSQTQPYCPDSLAALKRYLDSV